MHDPWLDPAFADDDGLVAVGGDLRPATMLRAYARGVFPWFGPGDPVCWWSPNPRAIIELDGLYVSRRLSRTLRAGKFTTTVNRAFNDIVAGCAHRPNDGTWITPEMIDAYARLHADGHAHSVEVWRGDELAGGIFGVAVGGLFAGESMFTRITDGSKVALATLVQRLNERGFQLFDVQFRTEHTTRMGAVEIPRAIYLNRLRTAVGVAARFAGE